MKIKIDTNSNDRLIQWGHANDTREVGEKVGSFVVIDQQDMTQVINDHATLIDGQIVLDEGYTEPEGPFGTIQPTTEQQLIAALTLKVAKLEASA